MRAEIDDLKVMRDEELISEPEFDTKLANAREEIKALSFDDMPYQTIEFDSGGKKKKRRCG